MKTFAVTTRWIALCGCLITLVSSSAFAQDPQQMFDDAVGAYQRGRFDSAAVGFLGLARAGIDDPRVWYNLGNAHFKAGRIGSALIAYRRGLRLEPRDADLNANYRYVRLFAADKIEPAGIFFLESWWDAFVNEISLSEARWAGAIAMWLSVVLLVWRLWPGIRRPVAWWIVGLAWCFWILTTSVAASAYVRDMVRRDGAVVVERTNVRNGPGDGYALQFVAHDGLLGTVERTESGWHLVRFPNGLKGWLSASDFELI